METHRGLEELIKGFARRIKEIEETSGPRDVRADKLLLELKKERLEVQLDGLQRGRPTIEGTGNWSRFFQSMGFMPSMNTVAAEFSAPSFDEHKAIVERMGFPADKICDKVVSQLAMRDMDAVPKPDVMLVDSHGCDNDHKYHARMQADLFNIPAFFINIPLHEDDKPTLASLNYIANQLGEFIEWAEKKFPGIIKYDEARHIEMLEASATGLKYLQDIYQLLKHVPCPIAPMDMLARFVNGFQVARFPNMQKALEYLRVFRDAVGERVASGKSPYPEERLRLLWAGQTHDLQTLNPSKLLVERKVALPMTLVGNSPKHFGVRGVPYNEMSEYGVVLSPLQEEADHASASCWGGPGKRWVKEALNAARHIGAHGIIHFQLIGCTPMRGMGSVIAERADKELGIPTLNFEGRYLDRDYMTQEHFEEILSAFIDKCFDRAGKPRQ